MFQPFDILEIGRCTLINFSILKFVFDLGNLSLSFPNIIREKGVIPLLAETMHGYDILRLTVLMTPFPDRSLVSWLLFFVLSIQSSLCDSNCSVSFNSWAICCLSVNSISISSLQMQINHDSLTRKP